MPYLADLTLSLAAHGPETLLPTRLRTPPLRPPHATYLADPSLRHFLRARWQFRAAVAARALHHPPRDELVRAPVSDAINFGVADRADHRIQFRGRSRLALHVTGRTGRVLIAAKKRRGLLERNLAHDATAVRDVEVA